jgi:hypothetical protein
MTHAIAKRLEQAIQVVTTEASAQPLHAFRGASGAAPIRGGARTIELSTLATVTFYLDVERTVGACGRLARDVADAGSLEEANDALHRLGLSTELDLERRFAHGFAESARP